MNHVEHEPMPTGDGEKVLPHVLKDLYTIDSVAVDLYKKADMGHKKYGTYLKTNNGRNALIDAYQEQLDLCMYLKQEILEKENHFEAWFEKIKEWGAERGVHTDVPIPKQCDKLLEEIGEWFAEVNKDREAEKMEFGDIMVTLMNIVITRGLNPVECGWMAYNKIKDRPTEIVDGQCVKK